LKAHKIQQEIVKLNDELRKHQGKCKHKKRECINKADTGNWDRNDDIYWKECYCPTCLKRWSEDQ